MKDEDVRGNDRARFIIALIIVFLLIG